MEQAKQSEYKQRKGDTKQLPKKDSPITPPQERKEE
jgi:hypothetical protein